MHADLLRRLLPPGAIDPNAELLGAEADAEGARLDAAQLAASALHDEADPRNTLALITDWERVAGLPDKCSAALATTLQERRAALVARIAGGGGASRAYFMGVAERLGYSVEIEEYRPFICGISQCGVQALNPAQMRFVWRVRLAGPRVTYFRCGESQVGTDPLLKITRAEDLECTFQRLKPAHTRLFVSYEGA
ncbi:YmfQ family protein [Denitromonas halophila]|uniref:DUF2313 domain-containing protein n=1 Tax=Denitromonas halophila TaxID=1629404 RepID=A0A557QXF2_9RHOO|nr:putative phage tail protein [Denitromonas halophila]TVO57516.1 DUF2313 domain-containing protein [Denitromonas halophila]